MGYDFDHLRYIRDGVAAPERLGYCLDTCHVTAAGYDLSTEAGAQEVLETFDRACGLENLLSLHLNDSQGALGSRLDRHAHIGEGCCGESCFRAILTHPQLISRPMILETAKEETPDGRSWDAENLSRLRSLASKQGGVR